MRDIVTACDQGRIYKVGLADGRVLPRRTYTQAMNANFQGLGATVITLAYLNAECRGLPVTAVVHDSITCEVTEGETNVASHVLQQSMADALHDVCPDVPVPELEVKIDGEWS
jgi:DNA polymerase I-like protein with 3'-5' exonuclease and polymerase domains